MRIAHTRGCLLGLVVFFLSVCMCVCHAAGYKEIVMQSLPQLSILDGLDRQGNLSHPSLGSLCDVPGLEDYVDLLLSSDTSQNEAVIIETTLQFI